MKDYTTNGCESSPIEPWVIVVCILGSLAVLLTVLVIIIARWKRRKLQEVSKNELQPVAPSCPPNSVRTGTNSTVATEISHMELYQQCNSYNSYQPPQRPTMFPPKHNLQPCPTSRHCCNGSSAFSPRLDARGCSYPPQSMIKTVPSNIQNINNPHHFHCISRCIN